MSRLPRTGPQRFTYLGLCVHIAWCNAKGVGDREILETCSFLFSVQKYIRNRHFSSWAKIFVDHCNV